MTAAKLEDGAVASEADGADGDARHQPHRRHQRTDQREGRVRITASDYAKRTAKAGLTSGGVASGGFDRRAHAVARGGYTNQMHKVRSAVRLTNERVEGGDEGAAVWRGLVNFKSETLPPERMLDALQLEQINYLSQPRRRSRPPASPAPAPGGGR